MKYHSKKWSTTVKKVKYHSKKSYGPITKTNSKIWKFPKSHNYRSRPKNPTFPEVAQNNVRFFLLPATTTYWYVLSSKKNREKIKNYNLNWNCSFIKLPKKHFSSGVQWISSIFVFVFAFVFVYYRLYFCICIYCICISVFLSFCHRFHFALLAAVQWPGSGYFQTAAL